ncbi:MAG: hypothetical protein M1828_004966 [Chrysothrix sp. TS-e1954]|nr:MAG: hypothetical protein M1828_004966 [Chrysothrix sp. TS-e1954]
MPLSTWSHLAPYHIVSYGTLLGSEFFQSFVAGIVAFRSLPRAQFSTLQTAIFPVYFGMQTALPTILALTYPGTQSLRGGTESGLSGFMTEQNRWSVLVPLTTVFITGLVNMVLVGPATTNVMKERKHQETRDGKKSHDAGPHSKEMQALNRRFGRLHGASTLINLAGLVATIAYGGTLAEMMA